MPGLDPGTHAVQPARARRLTTTSGRKAFFFEKENQKTFANKALASP
jgi:hypothetical protein